MDDQLTVKTLKITSLKICTYTVTRVYGIPIIVDK